MTEVIEASVEEARSILLARLGEAIGEGANLDRFDEALTHPSFANETSLPNNQRLEFLGDAVLGLCVSELLSDAHPAADEGALTRMRSALVNAEALARWARSVNLGACIALGRGARVGSERDQTNVLADAVEAVVASVYLARGLDAARKIVKLIVDSSLTAMNGYVDSRDPKSLLQERAQAAHAGTPTYRVKNTRGPEHDPSFEVEVLVAGAVVGIGEGRSKRAAERVAAGAALEAWSPATERSPMKDEPLPDAQADADADAEPEP